MIAPLRALAACEGLVPLPGTSTVSTPFAPSGACHGGGVAFVGASDGLRRLELARRRLGPRRTEHPVRALEFDEAGRRAFVLESEVRVLAEGRRPGGRVNSTAARAPASGPSPR